MQVFRQGGELALEGSKTELGVGDTLRLRGSPQEIKKLLKRDDIVIKHSRNLHDVDLEMGNDTLIEAVVAPGSDLEGQEIQTVNFPERFGAILLAIRHHGKLQQNAMENVRLSGGDSILLDIARDRVGEIERDTSFVVVSEIDLPNYRRHKIKIALGILVGVVLVAALNIAPIVIAAVVGSILMVLTGCLSVEEAHGAISWKIILLLAGVLPLGIAMEKTGAAEWLSMLIISQGSYWGPTIILSAFFFAAMLLTNIISNQATAVLLAPIAIQAAQTLDVNARPFLMAVTFAASLSFMTPVGYQTNTLIYGPGQYKFTDFTRVGTPLNILFWIIGTLLIPVLWPL
ncbi:MAG: anion permease [Anaerolineae bacterium]|nr:anion permease [Anaerolineae bacterium]